MFYFAVQNMPFVEIFDRKMSVFLSMYLWALSQSEKSCVFQKHVKNFWNMNLWILFQPKKLYISKAGQNVLKYDFFSETYLA